MKRRFSGISERDVRKLPRRRHFLHLAAGCAVLPAVARIARAQIPARSKPRLLSERRNERLDIGHADACDHVIAGPSVECSVASRLNISETS